MITTIYEDRVVWEVVEMYGSTTDDWPLVWKKEMPFDEFFRPKSFVADSSWWYAQEDAVMELLKNRGG